jgi:psiF repeat
MIWQGANMPRLACALAVVAMVAIADSPASAITPAEKMETCKFGADADKLTGAKRKRFLSRCMANVDAPAKRAKAAQQPK